MTTAMAIEDAGAQLPQLVERAEHGQQVVLTRDGRPVARIVPVGEQRPRPKAGFGKGTVQHMADDFDAPLPDFDE